MVLLLVAGVFSMVAPTWMICAIGLGSFEDSAWLQWTVRLFGLAMVALVVVVMLARRG